jgi:ParB family chromosome partitioning protein
MSANRLPSEPEKPVAENYASETEYVEAEAAYESRLLQYRAHSAQIETMVEQGKAQLLVDVSRRKPELCYRVIPETENRQPVAEDTLEKLRRQDERNREIAVEKGIEEVKRHVKENAVPDKDFSPREQQLLYFILFAFLRKDNHGKFGIKDGQAISEEEKLNLMTSLSGEQENALRRDFIIYALSQTSGDGLKSQLLLEFATLHFPDRVAKIKQQCNEVYRKKHERIEARIRELQPFTGKQEDAKTAIAEAIVVDDEQPTDPETFDEPDTEDIPLYPGLPEYATVGDIPEEEEQMFDTVYEDMAA